MAKQKKKFTDDSEDISKEAMRRLAKESDRRKDNESNTFESDRMWAKSLVDSTISESAYRNRTSKLREQVAMDERTASNEGIATKRAMSSATYQRDLDKMGFAMEPSPKKKKRSK